LDIIETGAPHHAGSECESAQAAGALYGCAWHRTVVVVVAAAAAVWALNTNGQSGAALWIRSAAVVPNRVSQEMSRSVRS
jgi:hypothetical protein